MMYLGDLANLLELNAAVARGDVACAGKFLQRALQTEALPPLPYRYTGCTAAQVCLFRVRHPTDSLCAHNSRPEALNVT